MAIITLTTDWQNWDYYSGMMKGRLLRLIPDAMITGINQHIEPFHVLQASFVLKSALPEFPEGSIHLFLVNQGQQPGIWPAVMACKNQFVIGWDDGILPLIAGSVPDYYLRTDYSILEKIDQITDVPVSCRGLDPSFPELSLFTRIAKYLAEGNPLNQLGPHIKDLGSAGPWLPVIKKDQIDGQVIFIDSYRNAITNIPQTEFLQIGKDRTFEITIKSNRYKLHGISNTYLESDPGELLAVFNSVGLLEFAVVQGNAADLLGFEPGTPIKIKFNEQ